MKVFPAVGVFDVAGTNDDIVDWVYIALLDGTTPSTKLQTRAAPLQRDGDVVEYDPLSATMFLSECRLKAMATIIFL